MPLCSILFLAAATAALYIIAGYPLLVAWLAARFSRPVEKREERRTVSILVPVHNGAPFLAGKLNSILALDYPRELVDVLVISDGSTDTTDEIALSFADRDVRLLRVARGGKAAALNAGIAEARGEILVLTDVRQTLDRASLRRLVACFADPSVGVVSGELLVRRGTLEETNVGLYWRYESWIRRQLGRVDSTLGATGPFYALRRELAVPIPPETLLDDVYLPLAAFFRGYRLIVEEHARAFDYPTSLETEFARKVRTLAGNYQLLKQYPALLSFRNRMLFHYASYKLGRLALPWLVLLLAATSFCLPGPWAALSIGAQAFFYGLAALDPWVAPAWFLKRFSSPARTVVSLLMATVVALKVLFVPPHDLWKPTRVRTDTDG